MTTIEFISADALGSCTPEQLTAIMRMCNDTTEKIKVQPGTFDLPAGYVTFYRYYKVEGSVPTYGGISADGEVST